MNIVIILFLMLLFLKILYDKILHILYELCVQMMYTQYNSNLYQLLRADTEGNSSQESVAHPTWHRPSYHTQEELQLLSAL